MHPMKLTSAVIFLANQIVCHADVVAQISPARLEAIVNGVRLVGSADIALTSEKSAATRDATIDVAVSRVKANQSFQLAVFLIANGTRKNVTSSPYIVYEHDGCLTVSQSGFVTVTPSRACAGGKYPSLIVALTTNDKSAVVAANEYFFRINE